MTPKALAALKESIAHWKRKVADPVNERIGPMHCALCKQFLDDGCDGCPVEAKTGIAYCNDTPYHDVVEAERVYIYGRITLEEFRSKCQLELDFLKSLLP